MNRVIHFEIQADDIARAKNFYESVFGWEIKRWGDQDYYMIMTGKETEPGIDGGLLKRQNSVTSQDSYVTSFICTIDVSSVDDMVRTVVAHGGSVVHPKAPIPGVGWLAYCKDTENNIFGLMQSDSQAQ